MRNARASDIFGYYCGESFYEKELSLRGDKTKWTHTNERTSSEHCM